MPKWEFIQIEVRNDASIGWSVDVILPPGFDPAPLKALCPPAAIWSDLWSEKQRRLVPAAPPAYRVGKVQDCAYAVFVAMVSFLAANGWEVPVSANAGASTMLRRPISG